jgi:hypothetical protein
VDVEFGLGNNKHGRLILLGGVQINMPRPMADYFCPFVFEIRQHGEETIDMLSSTFPSASLHLEEVIAK